MPRKSTRRTGNALESEFNFISKKRLRNDIVDAVLFTAYLLEAADKTSAKRYKEEFYRATVLYVASVVEALCLFLVDLKKISPEKIEYRHIQTINVPVVSTASGDLVIGIKDKVPFRLREIPFVEANRCLAYEKVISKKLSLAIGQVRQARNTQHLYGRTTARMSHKEIANAFEALSGLLETIRKEKAPK